MATSFPISYTWSPITSNQSSVVVNPKSTTVYSVTATHSGSCTSQKSVTVTVNNNISITQSNPSSLQPWLTSGSRMNLTITGLNNPVWSENEAHIVLVNPSSATVTVRSNVSPSTVMPNSTVTVSGSNVSPGCPTSASTTVFGINANFFPNGLITNCDGNNTKVLTAVLPFAGVQNYRFDWYKITNSSPVFVSSGNTLSVTKTGSGLAVGNARYFPQVVPINTSFPIAGNQSSVLADIKFSTQPTPVTQGTSPQNAILLDICVPVTVDNLCYANTYQPTLNINPSGDVYFYIVGAPVLPGFSPTGVEQTVGYDFEMCSKFNLPSALILPGDLATGDSFSTIHDNNTDNNPNLCKRGNYINPIMRRGRRYEIVVEGVANNRGPFTVKYTGVTGRPECSNFRKGTVNASNIIENTELNATIVANPLTTSIDITLPSADISKVSIVNLQGQEVKSLEMNTSSAQIPVAELSNGIYLVNVHQNGQLFNAKVNISK
ncbi:MAG: T9SS C-terminal target domain-containing protein [Cytophagales bacterium]|nr:MAG: T9SS C-terminal target domain-containing protein [Cytophagales bacterium]